MQFVSQKTYISREPNLCPNMDCRSFDVTGNSIEIEGRLASQEVSCSSCHCVWYDTYSIASYEVIEQPTEKASGQGSESSAG